MINAGALMEQAGDTAATYLNYAIREIDERFEQPGYAKAHPELVSAFMRTCAADFSAVFIGGQLERLADAVTENGGDLNAIGSGITDVATAMSELATAASDIAESVDRLADGQDGVKTPAGS